MTSLSGFGPQPAAWAAPLTMLRHHRYEVAARLVAGRAVTELCCGAGGGTEVLATQAVLVTGIDADAPTIRRASTAHAAKTGLQFAASDPLAWLQACGAETTDAVVWLDDFPASRADADAVLLQLQRLVALGTAVVVAIPLTLSAIGEQGVAVGWTAREARAAFEQLGDETVVLTQTALEGSAVFGPTGEPASSAALQWPERAEEPFASHLIGCAGVDVEGALGAVAGASAAPIYASYVHRLEQAALALERTNLALAREAFASSGSAGAGSISKRDTLIAELEVQNADLRAEAERLTMRVAELEADRAARRR